MSAAISIDHPYKDNSPNLTVVDIGPLRLYFSYKTIVAFRTPESGLNCSTNKWSKTTGRHIAFIEEDPEKRLSFEEFGSRLELVSSLLNFSFERLFKVAPEEIEITARRAKQSAEELRNAW
jgi:hypothetical protein